MKGCFMRVLVVDDSKLVPAVVRKTLELAEIPVEEFFEASNGAEGIERLRQHPVDLIFSDIHMPVLDGVEMIRKLRQEKGDRTPVIVVSTEGNQDKIEQLKALGVRAFIRKPFTPEMIAEAVNEAKGEGA